MSEKNDPRNEARDTKKAELRESLTHRVLLKKLWSKITKEQATQEDFQRYRELYAAEVEVRLASLKALEEAAFPPKERCTGITETCPVGECVECSVRDCPHKCQLHYHHDGCGACAEFDEMTPAQQEEAGIPAFCPICKVPINSKTPGIVSTPHPNNPQGRNYYTHENCVEAMNQIAINGSLMKGKV